MSFSHSGWLMNLSLLATSLADVTTNDEDRMIRASAHIYHLVNVYIAMERSTMLFMGKSTISTGPFSMRVLFELGALFECQNWFGFCLKKLSPRPSRKYEMTGCQVGSPPCMCHIWSCDNTRPSICHQNSVISRSLSCYNVMNWRVGWLRTPFYMFRRTWIS